MVKRKVRPKSEGSERVSKYKQLKEEWKNCTACTLHETADRKVFARGKLPCDVLFVGEAPGPAENDVGQPFVGRSGEFLDQWITMVQKETYNFSVCITNVVCCYPGRNPQGGFHKPERYEHITKCRPRLDAFLKIASPKAIVTLGKVAEEWGWGHVSCSVKPLHHPSYFMRNGGMKSVQFRRANIVLIHFIRSVIMENWEG